MPQYPDLPQMDRAQAEARARQSRGSGAECQFCLYDNWDTPCGGNETWNRVGCTSNLDYLADLARRAAMRRGDNDAYRQMVIDFDRSLGETAPERLHAWDDDDRLILARGQAYDAQQRI